MIAIIGAVLMPLSGRLADAGHSKALVTIGLLLEVAAWIAMLLAGSTIAGLAAGLVFLIIGQQAVLAATQTIIYALSPAARSRINAIFMTLSFLGGSFGSALGGVSWTVAGWTGSCVTAVALASLGVLAQAVTRGR